MNLETARFNMIEQQIRPWSVSDAHVLHLLGVVKREDFVPPAHRALAFADLEIPLPGGQCMLAPRVQARMMQELNVCKHEKVLEIGAGTGFMTALLAHRAQRVIALETNPELVAMARANLQRAGIHNAEVRQFDGAKGTPAESPFDVIVLGGSVAQVPENLLAQLKVGGRLLAIVGDEPSMQATLVTRHSDTEFRSVTPWDTVVPRLQNFPHTPRFSF